jgi:divinyl chlorophyllide a 8-vinyl-reductase
MLVRDTPPCVTARARAQKDSWAIDYQATLNALEAARAAGAAHFVLLSAICVQRPLLEFQRAKLRFEGALQAAGDITYSIVRPTAFFKSLAGQARAPSRPRRAAGWLQCGGCGVRLLYMMCI